MVEAYQEESTGNRNQIFLGRSCAFLSTKGLHVRRLAEYQCGSVTGAIYWKFQDKTELSARLLERVQLCLLPTQRASRHPNEPDPWASLAHLLVQIFQRWASDPEVRGHEILFHKWNTPISGKPRQ